jgi:hypothetical protein
MKQLYIFLAAIFLESTFAAPEATKSEFFETTNAGISVDTTFFYFHYYIELKIVKALPPNAHLVASFENPTDQSSFLKSALLINPDQYKLSLYSDPVSGVAKREYQIKIEVYSDEFETSLISKHYQTVESNLDQSSLRKLLPPDSRYPSYFLSFRDDGRNWIIGHQARDKTQIIKELILSGEEIENWSELVTLYIYFEDVDLRQLEAVIEKDLNESSKDFVAIRVKDLPNDIMVEWSHNGNEQWPPQREIKRTIKTEDGIYRLSYTVKEASYDEEFYEQWKKIVFDASLKQLNKEG